MPEMIYISGVDLSLPNGPGVNEQQFVMAAAREYGDAACFILPQPARALPPDFPLERTLFLPPLKRKHPFSFIRHQFAKVATYGEATRQNREAYVVLRTSVFPLAEWLIARRAPACFIKTAGSGRFEVFDRRWWTRMLKPLHNILFRLLLRDSSGADVVSYIHKASLEARFKEINGKVVVIDNAADTALFAPRDKQSVREEKGLASYRYLVGYVGNFADTRGATEMLRAWQHINQRNDLGLVIVSGDGVGRDALTGLAQSLGISERVHFFGPVPMSEVPDYMGMLDIGVSFREDDGCSELKVRQYLACGVPVLVSARVNEFVDKARIGITVARDDIPAIGRAASDILTGRGCRNAHGVREYAINELSYEAAMRQRREHWSARAGVSYREHLSPA